MLIERNPAPIELRDDNPRSLYQPGLERRDLVKTSPASFTPVSMHGQIFEHAVDASAVLRAGGTVLTTQSGEDLRVPRSTVLSTASIIAETVAITESDPTLSSLTLGPTSTPSSSRSAPSWSPTQASTCRATSPGRPARRSVWHWATTSSTAPAPGSRAASWPTPRPG